MTRRRILLLLILSSAVRRAAGSTLKSKLKQQHGSSTCTLATWAWLQTVIAHDRWLLQTAWLSVVVWSSAFLVDYKDHEYHFVWIPVLNEVLSTKHERNNPHNRYAIAAFKQKPAGLIDEQVVGHLSQEISRATYYTIIHGGVVTAKVADVNLRRLPLIREGLEIPVMVSVVIDYMDEDKGAINTYETLVNKCHKGPVDWHYADALQPF